MRTAAPAATGFQASLTTDDFDALCILVRRRCGVDLSQYKRGQMERRVRTWAQRRGTPDLLAYGARLQADAEELDAFLDRVTINVSHLWRHEDQWETLSRSVIPELAETGRIRCWSAGSSYGAEAYTLAAVARAAVADGVRVEITGTDLDRRMVARARAGRFSAEDARTAPPALLRRWFEALDDGGWQARPELMRMVRFEQGDLLRMAVPAARYDLVMCRNTVIYFTEPVRDALHERLARSLAGGGYLVVGTSERVSDPRRLGLSSPFHFVYRKG